MLQRLIKFLLDAGTEAGHFVYPLSLDDCIKFIVSEAAEAMDALMRVDDPYQRNNSRTVTLAEVDREVADVLFMAVVYFILRRVDGEALALAKVEKMSGAEENESPWIPRAGEEGQLESDPPEPIANNDKLTLPPGGAGPQAAG